jgi:Tetracyclin repressor-like, C-terminal domain
MRRWSQPARSAWFKDEFADEDLAVGIDRMNQCRTGIVDEQSLTRYMRLAHGRRQAAFPVLIELAEATIGVCVGVRLTSRRPNSNRSSTESARNSGVVLTSAPEAREAMASGERIVEVFMREVLPKASEATRALAADLIVTTFSAVGKQFSEAPRTTGEIIAHADAMADMFCAYLRVLRHA